MWWRRGGPTQIAETAFEPAAVGTPRIGATVALNLTAGSEAGRPYPLGSSFPTGPIQLGSRALVNQQIHTAIVTMDPNAPFGVRTLSNAVSLMITK